MDKNHINGLGYADSKIIVTPHGFITDDKRDNKAALDLYKKQTFEYWASKIDDANFELEEYEVNQKISYSDED